MTDPAIIPAFAPPLRPCFAAAEDVAAADVGAGGVVDGGVLEVGVGWAESAELIAPAPFRAALMKSLSGFTVSCGIVAATKAAIVKVGYSFISRIER